MLSDQRRIKLIEFRERLEAHSAEVNELIQKIEGLMETQHDAILALHEARRKLRETGAEFLEWQKS